MDIQTPYSACFSINQKPALARHSSSSRNICFKTKSQLQTPVSVNGGVHSSLIQTHKVTVHDRQRGVVHEFFVPEGYALLCVGFPSSDLEVETQDEDEVYWLQFGRYFARGPIERDDYALELAMGDE